jgi:hypothetical protein
MAFNRKLGFFMAPMLLALGGSAAVTGCSADEAAANVAKECGLDLNCEGPGIAEGNFAISGVAGVDGFFSSVVRVDTTAKVAASAIRAELDAIALSVGLEAGASGADIAAAVQTKIEANASGGLTVDFQPAKCEVSAKATIEATAKCDATVEPGSVKAECSGSCEAEVSASGEVQCDASAEVVCTGTAPNFECEGSCEGSCELDANLNCTGVCNGTCNGTCSAQNADGSCAGSCDGQCEGTCEIAGNAKCEGKCKGSCSYTPPDAKCEGGAKASCKADVEANAKVECSGKCEGEVTPPKASAECEASAKADAELSAECTPPSLNVAFEFTGEASAQAEFDVWVNGFKARLAALAAATAKAQIVADAALDLSGAAQGAVSGAVDVALEGDLSLKQSVGLKCALVELDAVAAVITEATEGLSAELSASAQVVGVVKS